MLEIGSIIDGKYKVINKIGQGGMSVVYLVMNERANKTWAIKEIRRDGVQDYEVVRRNLVVETDMLKRLRHEGLPSIIDVIENEDTLLIVMDYIEGNGLNKTLKEQGAQAQEDVVEWGKQLCEVMGYLHSQTPPIIYRDMKPSNVVLKPNGRVTLIDFGTAREFKGNRAEDTACLGTRGYAAPEQYGRMGETTPRTDIYCLGATLYHLVTGLNPSEPPYEMYPIRSVNPSLSSGLEKILWKCTRPNPDERYQSCAELMYDLEHYHEMDVEVQRDNNRKWRAFLACAVLTLAMAAGAVGFKAAENRISSSTYEAYIEAAEAAEDEAEQVEYYKAAIALDGSREEAYIGLVDKAFMADNSFTSEEVEVLREVLGTSAGGSRTNETYLKANASGYAQFAYRAGLAYYFYYTNKENKNTAAKWWKAVADSDPSYFGEDGENIITKAECLYKICEYYSQISVVSLSGEESISYADYWGDLTTLTEGGLAQIDSGRTACAIYSEVVTQVISHSNDFLDAGITDDAIEEKLSDIESRLTSDFTEAMNKDLGTQLDSLRENIATARETLTSIMRIRNGV